MVNTDYEPQKNSPIPNANRYHSLIANDRQFIQNTFALVFLTILRTKSFFKRVALAVLQASIRKTVADGGQLYGDTTSSYQTVRVPTDQDVPSLKSQQQALASVEMVEQLRAREQGSKDRTSYWVHLPGPDAVVPKFLLQESGYAADRTQARRCSQSYSERTVE